ncbi:16S rRNA (guanine(527)-N(7))-methyltransferase RsmG [Pantoea sp. Nvir]|uniref:16S rRNA (guanine(527)-N(7))-methyltransferase RsmG n=1 Tax=Pantoea sp. Nvir TaxID=2576760 RepID=UPI00135A624B|nr:16S rRNA (guanine(527)-N(7))-methyltransferase RsmG [Pantoea sp. Nvir]MXP67072.1 16S rRNA (guanine(527)-N(7))-methyltransferase RsmG [Pantoea sp. Nvir]
MITELNLLLKLANISLNSQKKEQLIAYVNLIDKWNNTYNLTSVRDPQQILIRHILDSIVIAPYLKGERFIDVGTGAGLPGIPLSIMLSQSHFTLLDSLGKRVRFLRQVQYELGLHNIHSVQSRIEEFTSEIKFDGVISRALSSLQNMVKWCYHLPSVQGYFYALKGARPDHEIASLPVGVRLVSIEELHVPKLKSKRHLIVLTRDNSRV